MALIQGLAGFVVRQLAEAACSAVGLSGTGEAVIEFLSRRFTDASQRLADALQEAGDRAWKGLEVALAGESLFGRLAPAEDRAFQQQVRRFLDASPDGVPAADPAFRKKCLQQLRAARKAGTLLAGPVDPQALARQAAEFARFDDPQALLDADRKVLKGMAEELAAGGYPDLARLLELEPQPGRSLLVVGVRYFFRRAVEEDSQLFQGLAFDKLERLSEAQEQGFSALYDLLRHQGRRLEALVVETHDLMLDLNEQIIGQGEQVRQIGQAVQKLLEQHQPQRRELRLGDGLSIRNDEERELVKRLVARYRALPEEERKRLPALLNAVGKLEVVAGDYDSARQDFQAVAALAESNEAQAEAHHNAYLACLEKRDWTGAVGELAEAVKLDAGRFAPFPVSKFQPIRILGAGGFGVAFLCHDKYMDDEVVVKTLTQHGLDREADKVFAEGQVLRRLDHPAVIRIIDCGYANLAEESRPFLVMEYFPPGTTLEEHVQKHGPLTVVDLLAAARQAAEGLHAAHGKGVLHRDVKPANLLVRKDDEGWRVKVIDFGLALRQEVVRRSVEDRFAGRGEAVVGRSIAGTADYAAPEQMGRWGEAVGPYSDVYGFAKTCCYALFQTPHLLWSHWQSLPPPLARLLEGCLSEDPKKRPQHFAEVLTALNAMRTAPISVPVASPVSGASAGSGGTPEQGTAAAGREATPKAVRGADSVTASPSATPVSGPGKAADKPVSPPAPSARIRWWSPKIESDVAKATATPPAPSEPPPRPDGGPASTPAAGVQAQEVLRITDSELGFNQPAGPPAPADRCEEAQALLDKGEFDQAIAACTKKLETDPNNAWAYAIRGVAYLRKTVKNR